MDFQAVGGEFVVSFAFGRQGASGGSDDGGASGLSLWFVVTVEGKRSEELPHVPFDIVGQYAKEDVGSNAVG